MNQNPSPNRSTITEPMTYQAPQIVLELQLEAKAGSPLSLPDLDDLSAEISP
jgi:hypothetical protein